MQWPPNLLDPSYGPSVLAAVAAGNYELAWAPLAVGDVVLQVSARPLKVEGVSVNVSATIQQQVADLLNAMLPTPKIMDLMWLGRAATVQPFTQPITSSAAGMLKASATVDGWVEAAGNPGGILVLEKTWCVGNSLLEHPGKAMNYGLFCVPNQPDNHYSGIATEACVSIANPKLGRVIQGQGWAHDPAHLDYSQWCPLVQRACTVGGSSGDLADVLQDPKRAPLLSHEGVLRVLRQPGVPVYQGTAPPPHLVAGFSVPVDAPSSGNRVLGAVAAFAVAGAAGWAVETAMRRRQRRRKYA